MKINYIKIGDYYIPLMVLKEYISDSKLGKYGRLRKKYLLNNYKVEYSIMLMEGTLYKHLLEIQELAINKINALTKEFAKQENINEELKSSNQLYWVQCMNNIKNCAEEIVLQEVVYERI